MTHSFKAKLQVTRFCCALWCSFKIHGHSLAFINHWFSVLFWIVEEFTGSENMISNILISKKYCMYAWSMPLRFMYMHLWLSLTLIKWLIEILLINFEHSDKPSYVQCMLSYCGHKLDSSSEKCLAAFVLSLAGSLLMRFCSERWHAGSRPWRPSSQTCLQSRWEMSRGEVSPPR